MIARTDAANAGEKIESITLCGYSRGAVTCFETARALHELNPHSKTPVPVDVVANQPVPGNAYQGPLTNARRIADCSDLSNLRNVSVILGAYTGELLNVNLQVKKQMPASLSAYKNTYLLVGNPVYTTTETTNDKGEAVKNFDSNAALYYVDSQGKAKQISFDERYNTGYTLNLLDIHPTKEKKYSIPTNRFKWLTTEKIEEGALSKDTSGVHRGFFSQILPRLPRKAHRDLIVIPRDSHHQTRVNAPDGDEHLHWQVAKYLDSNHNPNAQQPGLVKEGSVKEKEEKARQTYSLHDNDPPTYFPVASEMQRFFGLKKEMAYRYTDKLHPNRLTRRGMEWHKNETLFAWWQRHDKKISGFPTPLTKELSHLLGKAGGLRETLLTERDTLLTLFREAERWLILKENTATSRYYQVESLRAHVFECLKEIGVEDREIAALNREVLKETGYFLKHWTEGSKAASWFKTKETEALDEAFKQHDKKKPSKENDEALLKAMDDWLNVKEKEKPKSSRYELVLDMYEQLADVISSTYGENAALALQ